jgi:hypothetical protein
MAQQIPVQPIIHNDDSTMAVDIIGDNAFFITVIIIYRSSAQQGLLLVLVHGTVL